MSTVTLGDGRQSCLTHYIKSFMSNVSERRIFSGLWMHWHILYRNPKQLDDLALDLLREITLYLSIEDYAFGILQVNKQFNKLLSPQKSPMIMRQFIKRNCFANIESRIDPQELFKMKVNKTKLENYNIEDQLKEWQIIGTFAWINKEKKQYLHISHILSMINSDKIKENKNYLSIRSSLFLLHFMYKCRYIKNDRQEKFDELKQLILQLISNGGGLGFSHMLMFYYKETFMHIINVPIDQLCYKKLKDNYDNGDTFKLLGPLYKLCKAGPIKCSSDYYQYSKIKLWYNVYILKIDWISCMKHYQFFSKKTFRQIYPPKDIWSFF